MVAKLLNIAVINEYFRINEFNKTMRRGFCRGSPDVV